MKTKITVAMGLAGLVLYLGWGEYRMLRMEENVREIKGTVQDLRQELQAPALTVSAKERHCLALNIFHEAGVEDFQGKIAVGQVTLNRVEKGRWGDTICKVVYKKAQFSWTLYEEKKKMVPKGKLWRESQRAAQEVLDGKRLPVLNGSLFYHTDYIKAPKWADDRHKIEQIGQHIFYTRDKVVIKHKKPTT